MPERPPKKPVRKMKGYEYDPADFGLTLEEVKMAYCGFVPEKELPGFYNSSKLVLLPSIHPEGLPTTTLEAMVYGTPVLVTRVEGIPDIISDDNN